MKLVHRDRVGSGWRSGGPTGLQNQLAELNPRLVGSIPTRSRQYCLLLLIGIIVLPGALIGQNSEGEEDPTNGVAGVSDDFPKNRVSARGAFIRSLLIPGWGQSAAGSPGRGAFYFGMEGASLWMILKTFKTLDTAKTHLKSAEVAVRRELGSTQGLVGADLDEAVQNDSNVKSAATLVEDRSQQREDWIAAGMFFLLFGAADAFVTAHLEDFPEPLKARIETSSELGVGLSFSVPLNLFR